MSTVHSDPVVTDDGTDPADGTDLDVATISGDAVDLDGAAGLSAKQARILRYLREHAADRTYFKSRLIADDLGLSAKEVGANMGAVADAATAVDVEKWGYSSGTTWMVTS